MDDLGPRAKARVAVGANLEGWPAWDAVKFTLPGGWLHLSFVVIDPADLGATTVVAPGLMLDSFLPIPNAESLPFTLQY